MAELEVTTKHNEDLKPYDKPFFKCSYIATTNNLS